MGNSAIYVAASGGMAQLERMEILANNLANVSTTGFKGDRPVFSVEYPNYAGQLRQPPMPGTSDEVRSLLFAKVDTTALDLSAGSFEETGNPLNVALGGDGFLTVQGPKGELYTRAGELTLNDQGVLTTGSGMPVLDSEGGEITVPPGELKIDANGTLRVNGRTVASLKLVSFSPGTHLERVGHTLFQAVTATGAEATPVKARNPQLMQGTLETSNVEPVRAMVDLIDTQRAFEQFTKSLQSLDELEEKLITQVARPR